MTPSRAPRVRARGLTLLILGLSSVVVIGATAAAAQEEPQEVYEIGETAHTGDFDVTVHAVVDPWVSSNEFDVPIEGNHYVAVEASITNTSDDPLPFSSYFSELVDNLDRPWKTSFGGVDLSDLDAFTIAPGETRRGWVVYDIPPDATGLRIRIKGEITSTGSLFQLSEPGP